MADASDPAKANTGRGQGHDSFIFALPTPCALLDRTGRIEFANAAWATRVGTHLPLAPAGRNIFETLSTLPGGAPAAQGVRELLAGHRPEFSCDLCVSDISGAWIRIFATRDQSGSTLLMVVDMTDHPAAQNSADSEQRLQRIVESAMDGIITIDEQGKIIMFNSAAERIFGVPASEALGGTLDRFLPQRVKDSHAKHVRTFGRTGVSNRSMGNLGTLGGLRADGTEFAMEASISQATVGSSQFFTVILRDVSERKRLEAQLLQAQKMEGVGRLAGGIAHDFNNLLMAIFNYLALATRRLGPEHPVTPSLTQANQAAQRAADLTRQLLTFARKQVVAPRVLSPRGVAEELTPMLHRLIGEDIALRAVLAEDTGNVRADPAQLEQVLVNLVINARDAMPHGGTLTIESTNETLDEAYCRTRIDAVPGDYVVLSVTDTGTGMSPEVQARIFEPFFTTKPVGKGTGLGLATCHGIVKQSGGHIGVYSEQNRGTSVRVYLPRVRSDATPHVAAVVPKAAPRGSETILLAEDSALVREMLSDELRSAGYNVLPAASGPEALEVAAAHPGTIDLLLTDVVMPEMSGVQLAAKLTAERKLAVIYMSGYTEETIVHHGVDPDRMPFIAKPCMTDTLLHLIHRVLRATKK